jgi:hypothetical protein
VKERFKSLNQNNYHKRLASKRVLRALRMIARNSAKKKGFKSTTTKKVCDKKVSEICLLKEVC